MKCQTGKGAFRSIELHYATQLLKALILQDHRATQEQFILYTDRGRDEISRLKRGSYETGGVANLSFPPGRFLL